MPVFRLENDLIFPPVALSEDNGLLAIGGDLSLERLILAYTKGIFPWYGDGDPIMWWSPDPRFVIFLDKFRIPKSLKRIINKKIFKITIDRDFEQVISLCRGIHLQKGGTWITKEMKEAYINLHNHGLAHSVEVWQDYNIVGGLYGVSLGKIFFGESMFSLVSNASKIALVYLVNLLKNLNFHIMDSQVFTHHINLMGGENIPREEYLKLLEKALIDMDKTTLIGNWGELLRIKQPDNFQTS